MLLKSIVFISAVAIAITSVITEAGDLRGSRDHPMIKRFPGAKIVNYGVKRFDEFKLLTNKITKALRYGGKLTNANSKSIEGKITKITYEVPQGRSSLEVFRSYEQALRKANFAVLFKCKNLECGGRAFNYTVQRPFRGFAGNGGDQRFLAAQLKRSTGDVYVSLYTVRNYSAGGPTHNRIYTQLDIIEIKKMQTGLIKVDANAMARSISTTGRIALYGIYFDSNKAIIKSKSNAALAEIAKLMKKQRSLRLVVVGHTDNRGSFVHNMALSKRRAGAVMSALVRRYGIGAKRLRHWGAGYISPVASNRSEAGRAKNRRVELVEQ
jgi:outer membrane protein OmpA-like peptidoglycan-associated protein